MYQYRTTISGFDQEMNSKLSGYILSLQDFHFRGQPEARPRNEVQSLDNKVLLIHYCTAKFLNL